LLCAGEQILRGNDHARRAIAALQRVAFDEGGLQVGGLAGVGQALDRLHHGAVALYGQHQAAAHDDAVDPHGAGAADAMLAADMAAGEHEIVAEEIDQRLARVDPFADALAVDGESDVEGGVRHARGSINCAATRRNSTPARYFFSAPVAWMSSCGVRSSAATAASMSPSANASSDRRARSGVLPTPKKARRTSDKPLPLARAVAASPTM